MQWTPISRPKGFGPAEADDASNRKAAAGLRSATALFHTRDRPKVKDDSGLGWLVSSYRPRPPSHDSTKAAGPGFAGMLVSKSLLRAGWSP
jgi:hypothetical protein